MSNHPNRNPNSAAASPSHTQVRAARLAAGLTPAEAGALVYESARRWQRFEAVEVAERVRMHPAVWELFQRKAEGMTAPPRGGPADPLLEGDGAGAYAMAGGHGYPK